MYGGSGSVTKNQSAAVKCYQIAANLGNNDAAYSYGWCLRHGVGIRENAKEAVKWLKLSADKGNANAAYSYGSQIHSYYNPEYKDIPTAMVDLVQTEDGDRYIKYDAATMATLNDKKGYDAADLNAFEGQRWNALYFTKSYEAGKPLLADNFVVSNNNNKAASGYTPVHRFGEVVCYNLNKYTYGFTPSIYLSVKQSKNDKSAVADVPQVVGSMFGTGFIFLAGGVGAVAGIGGTLGTLELMKKKKNNDGGDKKAEEKK